MSAGAAATAGARGAGDRGGARHGAEWRDIVRGLAARGWFFWPAASAVLALGALVELRARMTPDVAWYLFAAGRVLDGARLYVDVVDVN
ncbi:MAG: hypothetical protein ACJ79S_04215, partial [Gemmatimonadaceae bacterium]